MFFSRIFRCLCLHKEYRVRIRSKSEEYIYKQGIKWVLNSKHLEFCNNGLTLLHSRNERNSLEEFTAAVAAAESRTNKCMLSSSHTHKRMNPFLRLGMLYRNNPHAAAAPMQQSQLNKGLLLLELINRLLFNSLLFVGESMLCIYVNAPADRACGFSCS